MAKPKYTENIILMEAAKYTFKPEFRDKSYNIFMAAYRRGILDKVCNHMILHGCKPVVSLKTGMHFKSQAAAAKHLGVSDSMISAVCCGKALHVSGHVFVFQDENLDTVCERQKLQDQIDKGTYSSYKGFFDKPIFYRKVGSEKWYESKSSTECAKKLNMRKEWIYRVLASKQESSHGYEFKRT